MSDKEKDKNKEQQWKPYQKLIQYKKEVLQNKRVLLLLTTRMSGKTVKFGNIKVHEKKNHKI